MLVQAHDVVYNSFGNFRSLKLWPAGGRRKKDRSMYDNNSVAFKNSTELLCFRIVYFYVLPNICIARSIDNTEKSGGR